MEVEREKEREGVIVTKTNKSVNHSPDSRITLSRSFNYDDQANISAQVNKNSKHNLTSAQNQTSAVVWYDPMINPDVIDLHDGIQLQIKKKLFDGGADGVIWCASAYKHNKEGVQYISDVVIKKSLTSLHDCEPDKKGEAKEDRDVLQNIFDTETEIMRNISHENIIRLLYDNRDSLFHVYPLYDMDLSAYMQVFHDAGDDMPVDIIASIARQLINAGEYLHSNGILYRDFKTSNVLVKLETPNVVGDVGGVRVAGSVNGVVYPKIVLTDFGKCIRARSVQGELYASSNGVGSVSYIPLEAHFGGVYTTKSDVFAFMNVIFRIYTGAYLFDHDDEYLRPMPNKIMRFIYGNDSSLAEEADDLINQLNSGLNITETKQPIISDIQEADDEYEDDKDDYDTHDDEDDPDYDFDTEYRSLLFNLVHVCSSYLPKGNAFDLFPDYMLTCLESYMIPCEMFMPDELPRGRASFMRRLKYFTAHGEVIASDQYDINAILNYWRPEEPQSNAIIAQFLLLGLHPDPAKRLSFRELQSSIVFKQNRA